MSRPYHRSFDANDSLDHEGGARSGFPPSAKLRAAKQIDPLQHSELCPGLSGLYSIVNGIRLALAHKYHFSDKELVGLMAAGMRFMHGRLTPERAITCGLPFGLWLRLADALIDRTRRRLRTLLFLERIPPQGRNRVAAFKAIEASIAADRPVLTLMRGGRYTVLSGFTPTSLLLFDSGGASWMLKSSIGLQSERSLERHTLCPDSFISIRS